MARRSTRRKASSPELFTTTPLETASPSPTTPIIRSASESPMDFEFNFNTTTKLPPQSTSSSMMKKKITGGGASATGRSSPSPPPSSTGINSVSDLKQLASSKLEWLKRQLELSHEEISKEIESSQYRLQKRSKIHTQACQKAMDEAEMDYKKMLERIEEGRGAMNASFTEFMAEAQASATRMCKTSIPDISKTLEKAIASLRSRYGISST